MNRINPSSPQHQKSIRPTRHSIGRVQAAPHMGAADQSAAPIRPIKIMPYTVSASFDKFYSNINLSGDHRSTANKKRNDIISPRRRSRPWSKVSANLRSRLDWWRNMLSKKGYATSTERQSAMACFVTPFLRRPRTRDDGRNSAFTVRLTRGGYGWPYGTPPVKRDDM